MKSRSTAGIALHPTTNGFNFYDISTGKTFKRSNYQRVSMKQGILDHLHQLRLEELEKLKLKSDDSIITAIQNKKVFNYKDVYIPALIEKHGLQRSAEAMSIELTGMVKKFKSLRGVHYKDIPEEYRDEILRARMLLQEKVKDFITILKARLVMLGNKQIRSKFNESEDINSPTIAFYTLCQMLVTAAKEGLDITTIDFIQAFLYAQQDRPQYAKLDKYTTGILVSLFPEEFEEYLLPDGTMYVELLKAIYGQIQAARLFNKYLCANLESMNFKLNPIDRGLFQRCDTDIIDGYNITEVGTHVDDLIITTLPSFTQSIIDEFKAKFGEDIKVSTTSDDNEVEFLGMLLTIDKHNKCVNINTRKYFTKLCSKYADLIDGKTKKVPAKSDLFDIDHTSTKLSKEEHDYISTAIYKIRYACITAQEITCTASFLVSRIKYHLTEQDKKKVIHLLQYINGRIDMPLKLGPDSIGNSNFNVYSDASENSVDGKPILAGVTTLGRGALWTLSQKGSVVPKSSSEAELIAASDVIGYASHQQQILHSRGITEGIKPGIFHEDNMSTINMLKNGKSLNAKTKHINIRYFFAKQYFDNEDFILQHCPTQQMIADILTKPLQGELFFRLRALLLGHVHVK